MVGVRSSGGGKGKEQMLSAPVAPAHRGGTAHHLFLDTSNKF